jgi:hypothetical protein
MIYPTMSVITFGAILLAILLIGNWYVWRSAYSGRLSAAHPVNPRGTGSVPEHEPASVREAISSAHDDCDCLKRVA